ncbi:hypothetical protein Y695_02979 [Hydrogenophaga sp. T4]|nr:hypothetical protein Y695_02979 [Hydrogenophaga sp. T4]
MSAEKRLFHTTATPASIRASQTRNTRTAADLIGLRSVRC